MNELLPLQSHCKKINCEVVILGLSSFRSTLFWSGTLTGQSPLLLFDLSEWSLSFSSERGLLLKGNLSGSVMVSEQVQLGNLISPKGQGHFKSMAKLSGSSFEGRSDQRTNRGQLL